MCEVALGVEEAEEALAGTALVLVSQFPLEREAEPIKQRGVYGHRAARCTPVPGLLISRWCEGTLGGINLKACACSL